MSLEMAALAYGLDPHRLAPVASTYRAEAAYRAGSVLLKPFRYGERQLWYATSALRHLERRSCPLVPRLVESRRGQPYVRAGDTWWYATTWIDGRPPRFPAELALAARSLALFHQAAEGCFMPYHTNRSWERRWQALHDDIAAFQETAAQGRTPFDQLYARHAPRFLEEANLALDALKQSEYPSLEAALPTRRGFCHRDCTAANLVVAHATGQPCLVDPDTWGPELRLYDLVKLLQSGSGHDPDAVLKAAHAYHTLHPLPMTELTLLPAAYRLPREFWWAGLCRYRRPAYGVDPAALLQNAIAGAPLRGACVKALAAAIS